MTKKKINSDTEISKAYLKSLDKLIAEQLFGCEIGTDVKIPKYSSDRNLSYDIEMEIFNRRLEIEYFNALCKLLWCPSPRKDGDSRIDYLNLWYIRMAAPWMVCEAALVALGLERNI